MSGRVRAALAPPSGLVAMSRWVFVVIGQSFLLGYLLQLPFNLRPEVPDWLAWLTAASLLANGVVWYLAYRRATYGGWDSVADLLPVFLVALTIDLPAAGADLVFMRTLLRSMTATLPATLLQSAGGITALGGGLLLTSVPTGQALARLFVTGLALTIATVLYHTFLTSVARYDRALERERVLARFSHQLTGRVDQQRICEVVVAAVAELAGRWVETLVAIGPRDRLQVCATTSRLDQTVGVLLRLDDGQVRLAQPSQPQARYVAWLLSLSRSNLSTFPISARDELCGLLVVDSPRPMGPNLRTALQSLCSSAGLALANATLTEELTKLAFHDPLTRLANRSLLSEQTDKALARAARTGSKVALLVLDLDGFKRVNDEFGHHAGDEALVIVSARLLDQVRDGDVVARLGGDEFAVLLTDLHDPAEATTVARRIIRALDGPLAVSDHELPVGVSIGIVAWPCPATPAPARDGRRPPLPRLDDLLHDADNVMYLAKSRGSGYEISGGVRAASAQGSAAPGRRA